jgi:hypothetical protein
MSMVVLIFSYHSDQISNKYYMRTYTYTRYYYVFVMYTFLWDLTESYYLYKCFTSDTENCRSVSDQTYKIFVWYLVRMITKYQHNHRHISFLLIAPRRNKGYFYTYELYIQLYIYCYSGYQLIRLDLTMDLSECILSWLIKWYRTIL